MITKFLIYFTISLAIGVLHVHAWVIWKFQLAGFGSPRSEACLLYSNLYCSVYWTADRATHETVDPQDRGVENVIWNLAQLQYKDLNWFNLGSPRPASNSALVELENNYSTQIEYENNDCCAYQSFVYFSLCRTKRISPSEFMSNLADYSTEGKELMVFEATYNETICLNIVHALHFGSGLTTAPFASLYSRIKHEHPYAMVPQDGSEVHIFTGVHFHTGTLNRAYISNHITFEWFKQNYICKEHPDFC